MLFKQLPQCLLISLFVAQSGFAYNALPRWGQATAVMDNVLYVSGGKIDEYNAYWYTSAPTTRELLSLDLSSSFASSSPPWELVSSSGPDVAWHTLSGLNSSYALSFGGQPGLDSSTVLSTRADSSWLLDIHQPSEPVWTEEAESWAGEPVRRIRHSTVTLKSGHVFLFGGELADGSDSPISAHYMFNPSTESFLQLPTDNGPSDITGHASVILANGTVLVFGGYQQSTDTLLPFSNIWAIETMMGEDNVTWTSMSVSASSLPTPRRAFAVTVIDGDKVLIHGGSSADFQTTYSDGWILDFSTSPGVWTRDDTLSSLGPRRDHFAVDTGSSVIFGFGYGSSGPVDNELIFYDPSSGTVGSSYTPPASTASPTQTMPGSTDHPSGPTSTRDDSGTVTPTSTVGSGDGNGGDEGGSGNGDGNGGNPLDADDQSNNSKTTAIVIGTTFGILGTFAAVVMIVWYIRRHHDHDGSFTMLPNAGVDDESPRSASFSARQVPIAGNFYEKDHDGWTILKSIGLGGAARVFNTRRVPERRDMLADEDTRVFMPNYERNNSSWSLRSILGGAGPRRVREPSRASSLGAPWDDEKNDLFSDGDSLMRDAELGTIAGSRSPIGSRQYSHTSTLSNHSYHDPFSDPIREEAHSRYRDLSEDDDIRKFTLEDAPPPPPRLIVQTGLPLGFAAHALSPVTEASRQSLNAPSSASSNSHDALSPFDSSSRVTSRTSYEGRSPRPSSIIDPAPKPVRRSDSWWNRFSKTSFLDRHDSGASRRNAHTLDFRDPNPPPRLIAIEESTHSAHSQSPESAEKGSPSSGIARKGSSKKGSKVYGAHGKSSSSLRTADSEAIERMVGVMDVAQRVRTGSNRTRESTASSLSISDDCHLKQESLIDNALPFVTSPIDVASNELPPPAKTIPPPISSALSSVSSLTSPRPSSVADRIRDYERQMSQYVTPPPTNTKQKEERSRKSSHVNYGFVPRASLFVANPDHRHSSSGDS